MIHRGDCLEVLDSIPESSLDACITDPPYHLTSIVKRFGKQGSAPAKGDVYNRSARGFMGQEWDGGDIAFRPETWAKVLRVLKPGAYIAAFSGTRTYHRMACAMEDAGFECIDMVEWLYGTGFSKSGKTKKEKAVADLKGKGRALKPMHEPIALMRKPREGTFLSNYTKYGTGYMEIDAMRVPLNGDTIPEFDSNPNAASHMPGSSQAAGWSSKRTGAKRGGPIGKRDGPGHEFTMGQGSPPPDEGRWPANVVHDGSDAVLAEFPYSTSSPYPEGRNADEKDGWHGQQVGCGPGGFSDAGSAARFYYCAKPSKAEKEKGIEHFPRDDKNNIIGMHPTVKPVNLMRWLVRGLVPQGGTLIDPFLGSGTTAIAAILENRFWIGCEKDEHYANIAQARIRFHEDEVLARLLS